MSRQKIGVWNKVETGWLVGGHTRAQVSVVSVGHGQVRDKQKPRSERTRECVGEQPSETGREGEKKRQSKGPPRVELGFLD